MEKIKQANLVGRGGACFPVATKWLAVKNAVGAKKYVVCNAAEGEPGVIKDGYILEHFGDKVIYGLKIAMDFLSFDSAGNRSGIKTYIFINHAYYKKFNKKFASLLKNLKIELVIKPFGAGYIGGEESAVLNAIEGEKIEPRLRPPFPTTSGLWGCPTLINNVETFYNVSLVKSGQFLNKRFYSLTGDCMNEGVFDLPDSYTIARVLKETDNYPKFPFFVQTGGGASGEVFNSQQLKRPVQGAGSITIHSLAKTDFKKMIKSWLDFYVDETCGQCTPCREGTLRLKEILVEDKVDWVLFNSLLDNLKDTSLCALGASVPIPIKSFINNVWRWAISEAKLKYD